MTGGLGASGTKPLREKILPAAFHEFGDKGFEGARIDDIAARAGTHKQAVLRLFGSKDGVFAATVREAYRQLRAPDAKILGRIRSQEPLRALHDLIEHLYKPSDVTVRFQRIMYDENSFHAAHLNELPEVKLFYRDLLDTLNDIIQRGQREGVFRDDISASQLYVFFAGALVYRITNASTLSTMLGMPLNTAKGARHSREHAIQFIIAAMRPPPPAVQLDNASSSRKSRILRTKAS